jgi:hypothetical protein
VEQGAPVVMVGQGAAPVVKMVVVLVAKVSIQEVVI